MRSTGGGSQFQGFGLFVPPSEEEIIEEAQPQQSLSGSTFGSAVWGEIKVVAPHNTIRSSSSVIDVIVDTHQDLIWSATSDGHVNALRFPDLSCYCAFSSFSKSEVRALVPAENFVLTVGEGAVRTHSRTGVPKSTFNSERQGQLFAATLMNPGQVALGGTSPSIYTYDVESSKVTMQVGIKSGTSILKTVRNSVYAGHMDGTTSILDPRSFRSTNSLDSGFTGGIQAMDVKEKLLCCSGYTMDRGGNSYLEGLVRVFDLRMMRALQPIAFAPGAFRLKFHPVFSGTMVLMAQSGQLQICDSLGSHVNLQGYHVDSGGGLLFGLDIASSGEAMFVSDSSGYVHQWVDREEGYRLNLYPKPFEEPYRNRSSVLVSPDDEVIPISLLDPSGGVLSRKTKNPLSSWPEDMWFAVNAPMEPIPEAYLENLQPARDGDFIMYSRVPKDAKLKRYQVNGAPVKYMNTSVLEAIDIRSSFEVFASPARTPAKSDSNTPDVHVLKPPGLYQEKHISYSRLGVLGFDFEFYNRTTFPGLENTLPNTYINGALQMLYYLPELRALLISHLCKNDFCLSCELGFLFQILDRSNGVLCQAKNLLRALDHIPLAKEMNLVGWKDTDFNDRRKGIALVERFVEFVFLQVRLEFNGAQPGPLDSQAQLTRKVCVICKTCGNQEFRDQPIEDCLRFVYPEDSSIQLTFGSILRESLRKLASTPASESEEWCNRCGNKQPCQFGEASVKSLPKVLFVFSGLGNLDKDNCKMWKSSDMGHPSKAAKKTRNTGFLGMDEGGGNSGGSGFINSEASSVASQSWVPTNIKVNTNKDLFVEEIANAHSKNEDASSLYSLSSVLCHIHDPRRFPGAGHSVLHQRITPSHTKDKNLWAWYLFNDFQVSKTSTKEALTFDELYKSPCVLVYVKNEPEEAASLAEPIKPPPVDWKVFLEPPLNEKTCKKVAYDVKSEEDLPKAGESIAIDAEFVCLLEEVTKQTNHGTTTLIRPMILSLARVSALRSDGRVLIDDYIEPCCPIQNYLTKYSGLHPGDLDPKTSIHSVVKLKHCYLKLLYLVEKGCNFVGHGLSKDFRILNIMVPNNNIRDTVDLFHLPRSRKISLRWLASYLLNLEIQVDTHDSIEDSATAMAVFRKYQAMVSEGNFENELQKMYEVGRNCGWETQKELKQLEQQLFDMLDEEKKQEKK